MLTLEPRPTPSSLWAALSPVVAIALTVVLTAVIFALVGIDVGRALWTYYLSPFADSYSRSELLVKAIPLALIGAGLAICFRANVWNIGAAGQYLLGAIAASAVALFAPIEPGLGMLAACLAAGAAGGAAWAAIPAALRTRFNANEILVSLMLFYVAEQILNYLVFGPWRDPLGFGFPGSADFPRESLLQPLAPPARVHGGLFIAIAAAVALWVMLWRTRKGFELRVSGAAPRAAAFAGFSRNAAIWFAFLVSGALAGLAGAVEAMSTIKQLQAEMSAEYGFTAIIVAFLGRLNPLGALVAALVLAVTYIGGEAAQILLRMPQQATFVFQGLLLILLLACDALIRFRIVWRRSAAAA